MLESAPYGATSAAFSKLLAIMAKLRDPNGGCPWDLDQSFRTIVPHTIEEAYEVADAIEQDDMEGLKGELGDLLFQAVFYAQMAREAGTFTMADVLEALNAKMIKRHPTSSATSRSPTPPSRPTPGSARRPRSAPRPRPPKGRSRVSWTA